MSIELRWSMHGLATALAAADALRRGQLQPRSAWLAAVAEHLAGLQQSLTASGLDEEACWRHLLPLATMNDGPQMLAAAMFRRLASSQAAAQQMGPEVGRRLAGFEAAIRPHWSQLADGIEAAAEFWQHGWDRVGAPVLTLLGRLTEPDVVASHARVALLPSWAADDPAAPAYGEAYPCYNLVLAAAEELNSEEPPPSLTRRPEEASTTRAPGRLSPLLRLAWLVAQLQIELPKFSESIPRARQAQLARFALLPAAIQASLAAGALSDVNNRPVEEASEPLLRQAWAEWLRPEEQALMPAATLHRWWRTYSTSRPPWSVALTALDHLLPSRGPAFEPVAPPRPSSPPPGYDRAPRLALAAGAYF